MSITLPIQRHLIVSGIPASGKSTIGYRVAEACGLPVLDKDEILESMFEDLGIGDASRRSRLSRAADEILRQKALQSGGAVIISWWRHPLSPLASGTSVEWLASLPGIAVELHCVCRPKIAAERFILRKRHSGHLDHLKTFDELILSFEQQADLGALNVTESVITVNTEQNIDLKDIIEQINSAALKSAKSD